MSWLLLPLLLLWLLMNKLTRLMLPLCTQPTVTQIWFKSFLIGTTSTKVSTLYWPVCSEMLSTKLRRKQFVTSGSTASQGPLKDWCSSTLGDRCVMPLMPHLVASWLPTLALETLHLTGLSLSNKSTTCWVALVALMLLASVLTHRRDPTTDRLHAKTQLLHPAIGMITTRLIQMETF